MRRRFNPALLPKHPPKHHEKIGNGCIVGSPFNIWFRSLLKDHKISVKEFSALIDEPYATVIQWRYRSDPRIWGICRIARGLEALGFGDYEDIKKTIKSLKAKK